MRLNEALQLDLADIQTLNGIDCFVITPFSVKGGDDKRIKTARSERIVPIHSRLKAIGFLDYVRRMRAKGEVKLFRELTRSAYSGTYSGPFSKWFREFLRHAGAEAPRTSFHSFRHNFRDALRQAEVNPELALALGGWTPAGGVKGVWGGEVYGSRFAPSELARAVESVAFQNLELRLLG